jgi:hypothetical protein
VTLLEHGAAQSEEAFGKLDEVNGATPINIKKVEHAPNPFLQVVVCFEVFEQMLQKKVKVVTLILCQQIVELSLLIVR